MRERDPFTRKACPPHAWQFLDDDYGSMSVRIERSCEACKRKESCLVTHDTYRSLPESLRQLADANWQPEK